MDLPLSSRLASTNVGESNGENSNDFNIVRFDKSIIYITGLRGVKIVTLSIWLIDSDEQSFTNFSLHFLDRHIS